MARAFIVLRRSDLPDNFLQVLDLVPNVSQQSYVYEPPGQTTYESWFLLDGINVAPQTTGVGPILIDGDSYGLSSYMIDRVEGPGDAGAGARAAMTPAQASLAAAEIEDAASNGSALTLATLNTAMAAGLVVSNTMAAVDTLNAADNQADDFYNGWTVNIVGGTGAGQTRTITDYVNATDVITPSAPFAPATDGTSVYDLLPAVDLDGTATNSSGSVEGVLQILSGERYKVLDGDTIADATPEYIPVGTGAHTGGFFTTGIGRLQPTITGPGGKSSFGQVLPTTPATQGPTEDLNHNYLREIQNTGDLHRSALLGVLAQLKDPGFIFINASLTYGAGGTAIMLDGTTVIGINGQAPAVQVYAADGTVI